MIIDVANKNKIKSIKRKNLEDDYVTQTKYIYAKDSVLTQIIEEVSVKYISPKTGLIDSVSNGLRGGKIIYKYFY